MGDYKKLKVWKQAHTLALDTYQATRHFPRSEQFGLVSQVRRAAFSVAANISEGAGRAGDGDFHRFLRIALGSASELEYGFLLSHDLGYLGHDAYGKLEEDVDHVRRMLARLLQRLGKGPRRASASES